MWPKCGRCVAAARQARCAPPLSSILSRAPPMATTRLTAASAAKRTAACASTCSFVRRSDCVWPPRVAAVWPKCGLRVARAPQARCAPLCGFLPAGATQGILSRRTAARTAKFTSLLLLRSRWAGHSHCRVAGCTAPHGGHTGSRCPAAATAAGQHTAVMRERRCELVTDRLAFPQQHDDLQLRARC